MKKVLILKCESYDQQIVDEKIDVLFREVLSGEDRVALKGKKVAVKVNLVSAISPEKCATTHPSFVEAVAKKILSFGADCVVCDSSGGPYNAPYMNSVYKVTEMTDACYNAGAKLNQDFGYTNVDNPQAKMHKVLPIINPLVECDYIINIAKLKTHTFMGYSGAAKNMFGAIPGLMKVEMHGNFKDQISFSHFIVDINETLKDKMILNIIDGVCGMEGEGPTGGTPVRMNCVIAGKNAYAVDVAMMKIMGLNPAAMPLAKVELERGVIQFEDVSFTGDDISMFRNDSFRNCEIKIFRANGRTPLFLNSFVHKLLTRRPYISRSACRGCGKCAAHCPMKAIEMKAGDKGKTYADVDFAKCIRCFCCQELCPFHVVKIKNGLLYRLVHR